MNSVPTGVHDVDDPGLPTAAAVRRVPRWRLVVGILIPLGLLVALVSWAFSSPIGASPDDDYHMASIWCAQGPRDGLCAAGEEPGTMKVPRVLLTSSCYAFDPHHAAVCPTKNPDALVETTRGNFHDHGYPPVFYSVMSVFAQQHPSAAVLAMRIFNALLFVGMMTAAYLLHQRRRRGVVLWSAFAVIVPFGMFIIPSINPSSWAVTSAATLWLAVAGFYEATTRGRLIGFGVLALLATLIGAGARADAAAYGAVAAVLVAILKFRRADRYWLRTILVAAIILVCAAFYLTSGQQSAVTNEPAAPMSLRDTIRLAFGDLLRLPWMWGSIFGQSGLGWMDTVMPEIVYMTALGIAAALAFHGLRRSPWRKSIAVSLAALALVVVPLYIIVKDRVIVGAYVQPRYIFPLLIIVVGLSLWGLRGRNIALSGAQLSVIAGGLAIANAVALHTDFRRYVAGTAVEGINLNDGLAWWWNIPLGPNWFFAAGALGMLLSLAAAAVYSWPRWSSPRRQPLPRRATLLD